MAPVRQGSPQAAGALIDSGPLVAFLNRRDGLHGWACSVFKKVSGPYLTSEANLAEVCHLLERETLKGSLKFFELLETGLLEAVSMCAVLPAVQMQVARFRDRRVDFADACLLVMAERHARLPIITSDRTDFTVYFRGRKGRLVLPPVRGKVR